MKFLSANQWSLLEEAASNRQGASILENNMLTISALYTRNLITFSGPHGQRRIKPTALGKQYVKQKKSFESLPDYRGALDVVRDIRKDTTS